MTYACDSSASEAVMAPLHADGWQASMTFG